MVLKKTGILLQVRLNSTRLIGKALLEINGKKIIEYTIERLNIVPADCRVILTTEDSKKYLFDIAKKYNWEIFVGDKNNVLKRFVDAARHYELDVIIRATGDNPFTSSEVATQTLSLFHKTNASLAYLTNIPYGTGVEVVSRDALEKAFSQAKIHYDFEHVTPFIYKNHHEFKVVSEPFISEIKDLDKIRLTVDNRDDFERIKTIIYTLEEKRLPFSFLNIVETYKKMVNYKNILFITGAGNNFGYGHYKRILNLSESLKNFNFYLTFKEYDEKVKSKIPANFKYIEYSNLTNYLNKNFFDIVLIDCRDTFEEEMELYNKLGLTFSFDDSGEGSQLANINVKSIPGNDKPNFKYNFSGIEYLNIKSITKKSKNKNIQKILISFGGKDPAKLTNFVYEKIKDLNYKIYIVYGPLYEGEKVKESDNVKVYSDLENITELFDEVDLIITSYGVTFFEALKSNLATLLINPGSYHDILSLHFGYKFLIKREDLNSENIVDIIVNNIKNIETEVLNSNNFFDNYQNISSKFNEIIDAINNLNFGYNLCRNCSSRNVKLVYRTNKFNMYKCEDCKIYYIENIINDTKNYDNNYFFKEYKEQYGKTYEEDRENIRLLAFKRFNIIKKYKKFGKLLDFGCGLGFFSEYAKENGFDPLCVDISDYAVEYINKKLKIEAIQGDIKFLESNYFRFDMIASFYVIEHIKDFEKMLYIFYNYLAKDGLLVLSTPNSNGAFIRYKFEEYAKKHPVDHYYIFSHKILRNNLRKLGFKKIKIVSTGIHPERVFKNNFLIKNKIIRSIIEKIFKIFKLGDTFEIYAQK